MSKQNSKLNTGRIIGLFGLSSLALLGGLILRERRDFTIMGDSPLSRNLLVSSSNEVLPDTDYFNQLVALLKREYVESVSDDMKFATGAVRGMILSLSDNYSAFYDLEDARVFRDSLRGNYDGFGVDLRYEYPPLPKGVNPVEGEEPVMAVPRVVVSGVVPNGPAARAGIRVGDWFETVDGAWVQNMDLIQRARVLQAKIEKKELPSSAMDDFRKDIRAKMEKNISPKRAWQKIMTGKSGESNVVVMRNGVPMNFTVVKRSSNRNGQTGSLRPSFLPDSVASFGSSVKSQSSIKIDLRGATIGDFNAMMGYANLLAKQGSYGQISRQGKAASPIRVAKNAPKKQITVWVDETTNGVPAVFALILKQSGASVQGKMTVTKPVITEVSVLPDGTTYTLNLGMYAGGAR